jgi:hypothetical protein
MVDSSTAGLLVPEAVIPPEASVLAQFIRYIYCWIYSS